MKGLQTAAYCITFYIIALQISIFNIYVKRNGLGRQSRKGGGTVKEEEEEEEKKKRRRGWSRRRRRRTRRPVLKLANIHFPVFCLKQYLQLYTQRVAWLAPESRNVRFRLTWCYPNYMRWYPSPSALTIPLITSSGLWMSSDGSPELVKRILKFKIVLPALGNRLRTSAHTSFLYSPSAIDKTPRIEAVCVPSTEESCKLI